MSSMDRADQEPRAAASSSRPDIASHHIWQAFLASLTAKELRDWELTYERADQAIAAAERAAERVARRLNLQPADRDDFLQDLYLALLTRKQQLAHRPGEFHTWLHLIVRQQVQRLLQRRRTDKFRQLEVMRSLHDVWSAGDDDEGATDPFGDESHDRRTGRVVADPRLPVEQFLDVKKILPRLSEPARRLCELLLETDVTTAMRAMGLPRTNFYRLVPELREALRDLESRE